VTREKAAEAFGWVSQGVGAVVGDVVEGAGYVSDLFGEALNSVTGNGLRGPQNAAKGVNLHPQGSPTFAPDYLSPSTYWPPSP